MEKRRTHTSRFTWIVVAVFALASPALGQPALAAEAGRIASITPSCANVGDRVTITGIGFGEEREDRRRHVTIAVDGVPAQVVAATGHSATFIVPAGVRLGPTTVTATNPGGHTGSIAFRLCDLLVPAPWAGEWAITITFRKATTHSVTATDHITAFIRSGEPFGLAGLPKEARCTGSITDEHLEVHCAAHLTPGTCTVDGDVQLAVARLGETLDGSGAFTSRLAGACGPFVSTARTLQVSGLRLSLNPNASDPPVTLLRSFVLDASLFDQVEFTKFAAFNAEVEIERGASPKRDAFEVKSTFTLGTDSKGIDPAIQTVTLQVGTFSITLPAGSFAQDRNGRFKFHGVINGVTLEAEIARLSRNTFKFTAEGRGANLTGTASPLTVAITIGDDGGSTTVSAEFE